jgi:hypothetical protein
MRSDYLANDLKQLWKELASNPVQLSPDDLRREAGKLRIGLLLRNWFAAVVCFLAIVAYAFFFVHSRTVLERVGAALSIVGAANVIVQFLKRPARSMPDSGATECIRFYRAELERQRDFHRGKGLFSWLLIFLPGPIVFNVAFALDRPQFASIVALQMAAMVIAAAIVVPLNLSMSRKYQRRIDALDTVSRS